MSYEEFNEKRFPVIKVDDHYCLLTTDSRPLPTRDLPSDLFCYDICKSEKTEGPVFKVSKESIPDLYRWGRLMCKEPLPFDDHGEYSPAHASALHADYALTAKEFQDIFVSALEQARDDGMLYRSSFGLIPVYPHLAMYCDNDNLYVGMDYYDEEEQMFDHFGDVTVNIDSLPYLHSTIDTNNNGDKILDFLQRNGLGETTGRYLSSGFCRFPVFHFNEQALHAIDLQAFEAYAKTHGQEPNLNTRLDQKLQNAAERAGGPTKTTDAREPSRG